MSLRGRVLTAAGLVAILTACAGGGASAPTPPAVVDSGSPAPQSDPATAEADLTLPTEESPMTSNAAELPGGTPDEPGSAPIDPGLRPWIDLAVADLSLRLDVPATAISAESATLVVWPNRSLGCPAPGRQYPAMPTDGAKIVLVSGGRRFAYHAGESTSPFLCENSGVGDVTVASVAE